VYTPADHHRGACWFAELVDNPTDDAAIAHGGGKGVGALGLLDRSRPGAGIIDDPVHTLAAAPPDQ
jgi:hypothetical protein